MATLASFLSCSPRPPPSISPRRRVLAPSASLLPFNPATKSVNRRFGVRTFASSASPSSSSDWGFSAGDEISGSKKPVLFDLIRDIEPLDVSLIQKDVSITTIDAMKRTISGMLGLLPSDQFQVMIDALWESLSKLLISSMMTGYTLRNAEYRLCLERNLDIYEENTYNLKNEDSNLDAETNLNEEGKCGNFTKESSSSSDESEESTWNIQGFDEMTPEARRYILTLHSRISLVKKELHEVKRKSAALQMQQFVGEEKNDLLDYLRSLQPEKVLELSEPTSAELKETIHSVVHGLLATLSPKMHSKSPDPESDLASIDIASMDNSDEQREEEAEAGDCIDTSLHFHPLVSLPRDYLARLLFWCMLLGHYLRGLEYRLELMDLLSLPSLPETGDSGCQHSV